MTQTTTLITPLVANRFLFVGTVPLGMALPPALISLVRLWDWTPGGNRPIRWGIVLRYAFPWFGAYKDVMRKHYYARRWRWWKGAVVLGLDTPTLVLSFHRWSGEPILRANDNQEVAAMRYDLRAYRGALD